MHGLMENEAMQGTFPNRRIVMNTFISLLLQPNIIETIIYITKIIQESLFSVIDNIYLIYLQIANIRFGTMLPQQDCINIADKIKPHPLFLTSIQPLDTMVVSSIINFVFYNQMMYQPQYCISKVTTDHHSTLPSTLN